MPSTVSRAGRIRTNVLIGFCAFAAIAAMLCSSTLRAQLTGDEAPVVDGPTSDGKSTGKPPSSDLTPYEQSADEQAHGLFDGPEAAEHNGTSRAAADSASTSATNSSAENASTAESPESWSDLDHSDTATSPKDDAVEVLKKFKALRASRQWKKLQSEKVARRAESSTTQGATANTAEANNTPVDTVAVDASPIASSAIDAILSDATATTPAVPDSLPAEVGSFENAAGSVVNDSAGSAVNTGALDERAVNTIRKHKAQTVARRWKQLASMKRMAGRTAAPADPTDALAAAISQSDDLPTEDVAPPEPEEATHPSKLKPLSAISPYLSYEPDAGRNKAANNQCPCTTTEGCECPTEISFKDQQFVARMFPHAHMSWEASNIFHLPIYFEDHTLERYGHTRNMFVQPAVSMGVFTAQFFGLPYQMAIDPVAKRRYTLGWYRPGANVPAMYYQIPWNTEAALTAAGVYTAGTFVFPP